METKKYNISTSVAIISSFILIIMNQLFAFIGGSVFFKTIFHVPLYIGVMLMGIFYSGMIFMIFYLDKE